MRDTPTDIDTLNLVEKQGETLLNAIAYIAAGDTDFEIEIPEGIDVMSNLAIAISFLAEDIADRIKTQNELVEEMELRVTERTLELEIALESLQRSQRVYLHEEWSKYLNTQENQQEDTEWLQSSHFLPALQKTALNSIPSLTTINGNSASALTVPINFADKLIGMLGFEGDELADITDDDLSAVEDIAEQVGLALENQRLFNQTQRALSETQVLYEVSALLNAADSTAGIMSAITSTTVGSNLDSARLWLTDSFDDGSMWLEIAENWGSDSSQQVYDIGFRFECSNYPFLSNLLKETREVTLISSVKDDPRTKNDTGLLVGIEPSGLNSFVYLPLLSGTKLIGLFVMGWKQIRMFDESDTQRFTTVGSQMATAVAGLRLLDQTRLALSETQNLYEISAGLNAAESTQDITNVVIDSMIKDGIYTASLWLVTPTSSGELLLDIATDWTRGSGNNQSGSESLSGSFELSDFPFFANLLLKSPKVTLISSPEEELGIREDENLAAVVNALNIKSIAFLPLLVGRRPIGLFSMAWQQTKVFDPADSQRFTAIAAQIATAIDSLRLLDQTQQALSETQALYQISARLNAAESTKDIVNSVVDTLQGQEVDGTRLWLAHSSGHTVQAIENTHSWFKNAEQDGLAENLKLDLADFPYMFELLNTSRELQLIPSISTDSKLIADSNLLESVRQSGYSSMAFLPLSVGSNLIGLFTIGWNVVRYFTELDHQYFTAVGAQIATTVESLRLLEDTKLRAAQLERLTEIETALSSAANENEILQAMASGFDFARGGLHYVDSNLQNIPNTVMSVAIHENNEFVKPEFLSKQGDISGFLASEVWLSKPNAVTVIPNMFEYPGITQKSKEISEKMEATTFCVVPLLSGRRWQGILTLSWAEAHELSSTESFLLENLREPLSAIVARHRSQLAAQKARQESEQLYNASSHLNRAASNINNIVTVVAALAKPVGVFQTVLAFTQTDRHGEPIGLEVSAIYKDTELERSVAVGDRFGQVLYKQIATFTNAHFMEGVTEEGVDENAELAAETKKLQDQLSSTAAGILPLTVGDEKVGFMFLLSDRPTIFDENSRRLFSSLAPQIAVAVQNSLLLDGAQTRANREQALRQISEKVRNTSDVESVMRTAVTEIGRVLGRKTFLYLKDNDDDTSTKANK